MGAIFGIVGEGSRAEVEDMGERSTRRPSIPIREVAHRLWSVRSLECWARHFPSARRGMSSQTPAGSD